MSEVVEPQPAEELIGRDQALFDPTGIDPDARIMDKAAIEEWIPHRGAMSLLDGVVWLSDDKSQIVGIKHNRSDEFWVPGHFPHKPLLPGVLMIEAAAQLMSTQYNIKGGKQITGIFTRIENCAFRQSVTVGDDLYILVNERKFGGRRFQGDVQGWVNGKVAFDAQLSGIVMMDKMAGG
ncbi:MAG: FabA/FabZ family ACP-dehydratase [Planctomycetota bacterium]